MLDVLKHRLTRDNDACGTCGGREPGGLYFHTTGWYCQLCLDRIVNTEARLGGYGIPEMPRGYLWPGKNPLHKDTVQVSQPAGYPHPQWTVPTPPAMNKRGRR